MDDFLKNIKNIFSVEHVFSKDREPVMNQDEDVLRTLGKIDPSDIVDADEIAARLNEIHQKSKTALDELKVQSSSVIDSAKSQSSQIIDSAKSGFGVLQKPQPPEHEVQVKEEDDPYTADDSKANSNVIVIELKPNEIDTNDTEDVISKLDDLKAESLNALDELMTQSNKIIELAEDQSNKIIDEAKTNLTIIQQKVSNESLKQDQNTDSTSATSDKQMEQVAQKSSNINMTQDTCDQVLNFC